MEDENKPLSIDAEAELTRILNEQTLMTIFHHGWKNAFDNRDNEELYLGIERTAYNTGWSHAIMGDDLSHIDYLTDDEIILRIKNTYNESNVNR